MQRTLSPADLECVLALARGGTLAQAGALLGAAPSTVFRVVQRLERQMGQRLFERSRRGYRATALAATLCSHAEAIESELAAAESALAAPGRAIAGTVRVGAVDAVLTSYVIPALPALREQHPQLNIALVGSNELSSLTHRELDIALRSTQRPPPQTIGRRLGTMHFAVFGSKAIKKQLARKTAVPDALAALPWIAIDDAMPEHPGVAWRRRHWPQLRPVVQANSMLAVAQLVEAGVGVAVMALFHARSHPSLVPLTPPLERCEIDLWLLTHPESRHLRRIAEVATHIERHVEAAGGVP